MIMFYAKIVIKEKDVSLMSEYENMRRISYEGGALFVPVCTKCGRFVKADKTIFTNEELGLSKNCNSTCKKCGRTHMLFEGFFGDI